MDFKPLWRPYECDKFRAPVEAEAKKKEKRR